MPLGRQFSNTYWEDPNSKKVMSSTENLAKGDDLLQPERRKPEIAEGFGESKHPQGMLFSPYSYTGLKQDPTVSTEQRLNAINKALNLQTKEELTAYENEKQQRAKERGRSVKKKNVGVKAQKIDAIRQAANDLDIPTHDYNTNISAAVYPTDKLNNSGVAYHNKRIEMGVTPNIVKETTKVPTSYEPSEKPITNTNFWDDYHRRIDHTVNSVTWENNVVWTSPSGEHIVGTDGLKEHTEKVTGKALYDSDLDEFLEKNNYTPNVFPGKGSSTDKHSVGNQVDVESGYRFNSGGDYYYQKWHTRYEPDKSAPIEATEVTKNVRKGYKASKDTLAHELGHTTERRDSETSDYSRRLGNQQVTTDPVSEGYADALADRVHHYSNQFEHYLTNPVNRAHDIKNTGYSSTYHMWNAEERALYSAVRYHIAAHPEQQKTLANRGDLFRPHVLQSEEHRGTHIPPERLMLGHMYEHQPHIRPVLDRLGFTDTATKAHEEYMSRQPRRNRSAFATRTQKPAEQLQFPGM